MGEYSEPELQSAGGSGMSQTPPSKISTSPSCKKPSQKSGKGKKEALPNCRDQFGQKRLMEKRAKLFNWHHSNSPHHSHDIHSTVLGFPAGWWSPMERAAVESCCSQGSSVRHPWGRQSCWDESRKGGLAAQVSTPCQADSGQQGGGGGGRVV